MISPISCDGARDVLTLRHKIGQMLIMGFEGCEIHDDSLVAQWLSGDGLGGVLLFDKDLPTQTYGKNIKTKAQVSALNARLTHFASKSKDSLPLFIAIDYEGGAVDRLAKVPDCMKTLNAQELSKLSGSALDDELSQMANTIKQLGFNLNFAPVVDLHLQNQEGIIGALKRSYSDNPLVVSRLAHQFVEVFSRHGIACCYKHFPGHGSATGDTHEGFVDVTEHFQTKELEPYQHLLHDKNQPVMVMTAHVINKKLDSKGLPATLSYEVLTGLLRNTLGYEGVIISDDLQMQAIAHHYSLEESLSLTINAGADMMIFGNQLGSISATKVIDTIEQLVLTNTISQTRIDEAFNRVKHLKQTLLHAS